VSDNYPRAGSDCRTYWRSPRLEVLPVTAAELARELERSPCSVLLSVGGSTHMDLVLVPSWLTRGLLPGGSLELLYVVVDGKGGYPVTRFERLKPEQVRHRWELSRDWRPNARDLAAWLNALLEELARLRA
jgi:hypothetical protein